MTRKDIVFSFICGIFLSWLLIDFFGYKMWPAFFILPEISILGLKISEVIGRKITFAHQAGKFILIGIFADIIDIKVYQFLFLVLPFSLFLKAISFILATVIKYWWNKNWAFEKNGKDGIKKEMFQFFAVTIGSLALNLVSFYYLTVILGPQLSIGTAAWTELSIIMAALVAALCNFTGYKFIVFKK